MTDRWAVGLTGEQFDLEDTRTIWLSGSVRVRTINLRDGRTVTALSADAFEGLTHAAQVREVAKGLIDTMNGVLYVRDGARRPLRIEHVHEMLSGEWGEGHVFIELQPAVIRMRAGQVGIMAGGVAVPSPAPAERNWLQLADSDNAAADVLSYLRADPDWFDLYKAFERMRDDINRRLRQHRENKIGWPAKATLDRFAESAQAHRHSPAKWRRYDLSTAMNLDEARAFLRGLARTWLQWRMGDGGAR